MVQDTRVQSKVKSYQRFKKIVLDTSLLKIIKYGSKVSGAFQGKEWRFPLHLGIVAMEKGAFVSPLTTVGQLIYIYIYINKQKTVKRLT